LGLAVPPVEPPPSRWHLDLSTAEPGEDLVGIGADLEPGTLLAAYRAGLFPMGTGRGGRPPVGWWSPDPRGVLPVDGLRVSRSLRKMLPRYEIRVDTAFREVLDGCADRRRPHGWIDRRIRRVYTELHERGVVHSVEAWSRDGKLAGGLYGVSLGGLFAGESMFHRPDIGRDASKAALVALVDFLVAVDPTDRLLDVQWVTPHLASLGVVEIAREDYLELLAQALRRPAPDWTAAA
jgi:leucyl/phenylalanyl-tRNA---protein transferase